MSEGFGEAIAAAYAADGPTVDLGRGVHEGKLATEAVVQIPLRMINRHGLVAGATGTGKTVTLQTIAEQLAARMEKATVDSDAEPRAGKPQRKRKPAPPPSGGVDALGDFLTSREGKAIQRKVLRGVFGMLKKRL